MNACDNKGKFFFNEEIQNEPTYKYDNITSFQINGVIRLFFQKKNEATFTF